ncbi:PaaI family thioesterase [Rhodobacteraceae bacterium NNCM2]|nr:PaaI family thioesterase [Coraliihabitans acroporae]
MVIEEVSPHYARLRMPVDDSHLRPGGTVSGPSMFTLADCAFYVAVLAMIGREALTVTTNLNINFLRKPEAVDLIGEARILKLGKLLATGDVTLYSEGSDKPVAHATTTYAIPPRG